MVKGRLFLILIVLIVLSSFVLGAKKVKNIPTNNPPIIQFYSPANFYPISMKEGESVLFYVQTFDPENDLLIYRWYYDNKLAYIQDPDYYHNYQSSWNYISDYYSNGSHLVRVEVSDGIGITAQQWSMFINDNSNPPQQPPKEGLCVMNLSEGENYGEIMKCSTTFDSFLQDTLNQNDIVNCNGGVGGGNDTLFGQDRSPGSIGITKNYTHTKNITVVKQFQNWTYVPHGNMSCVPAVTASGLEYWNRTLPGLLRGLGVNQTANRLHRFFRTNETLGTPMINFSNGIIGWINGTKYPINMSITIVGNSVAYNASYIAGGVNFSTINGTGDDFFPVAPNMIFFEFISKNEFTILIIQGWGGQHAIAIHSLSNVKNADGNYDVAIMDPATGEIKETEIDDRGAICIKYDDNGKCEEWREIMEIWSISLRDD
ncbi:MAG TPA: hypothetical protein VJJ23_02775 [Candidatus Nanoarchaeia archaeon]|nr:hypothetical protein [Candidatus Nanoarchaeia archaeon]